MRKSVLCPPPPPVHACNSQESGSSPSSGANPSSSMGTAESVAVAASTGLGTAEAPGVAVRGRLVTISSHVCIRFREVLREGPPFSFASGASLHPYRDLQHWLKCCRIPASTQY